MIRWRLFYPVVECAEYLGVTPAYLYKAIANGEREEPPDDAILPDKVRRLGGKITIHRSFLYPNESDNITQFPQPQALTDTDVKRIADAVAACLIVRLIGKAA